MGLIRVFVALDLTADDRAALDAFLELLRPLPGRPVPPANWHITLRFHGPTDEVGLERLLASLDEADKPDPFGIRLAGLGAFPRPAAATVLWLGVEDEPPASDGLAGLAGVVEEASIRAGFEPEDRPFHAHLTLSRIRPAQDVWQWLEREPVFPRRLDVHALTVFESRLGRGGATYRVLDVVGL